MTPWQPPDTPGLEQTGLAVGVPAPCESPPPPGLVLKEKGGFLCSFPAGGKRICHVMTRVSAYVAAYT